MAVLDQICRQLPRTSKRGRDRATPKATSLGRILLCAEHPIVSVWCGLLRDGGGYGREYGISFTTDGNAPGRPYWRNRRLSDNWFLTARP